MPDQIYSAGPLPAPLKYNVPGSQRMIPRACQALYDGSGASGDYVPALIFRSQAGHVIARAILDTTVTAGDDAEVSWFPGVKHAAGAAVTTQSWLHVVAGPTTPSGSITLQSGTQMTIADFNTNDTSRFTQTSAVQWTITRGVYIMTGQLRDPAGTGIVADGDFSIGINSFSGFACYATGVNGETIINRALGGMTIGDQSSFTAWRLLACGSDSHSWVGEVDLVHVLGT